MINNNLNEIWIDNKGRHIKIHTMSDKWLNNIRKKYRGAEKAKPILAEIKRRKKKKIIKRNNINNLNK